MAAKKTTPKAGAASTPKESSMSTEDVTNANPDAGKPTDEIATPPAADAPAEETTPSAETANEASGDSAEGADTAAAPEVPAPTLQATSMDSVILEGFQHRMQEHLKAMAPAVPINAVNGARIQYNFYRLLLDILRQEGSVFTKGWSDLLSAVNANLKGSFEERYAYRFINEISALTKPEIRVFMNLLRLVCLTADSKGRGQALKAVDFAAVTKNIPVANAGDKLHGFYYSA